MLALRMRSDEMIASKTGEIFCEAVKWSSEMDRELEDEAPLYLLLGEELAEASSAGYLAIVGHRSGRRPMKTWAELLGAGMT